MRGPRQQPTARQFYVRYWRALAANGKEARDEASVSPAFDAEVWFLPYPPSIEDVLSVADNGLVMPAKSTLFFPKLPSGLMIRHLDID